MDIRTFIAWERFEKGWLWWSARYQRPVRCCWQSSENKLPFNPSRRRLNIIILKELRIRLPNYSDPPVMFNNAFISLVRTIVRQLPFRAPRLNFEVTSVEKRFCFSKAGLVVRFSSTPSLSTLNFWTRIGHILCLWIRSFRTGNGLSFRALSPLSA